MAPSQLKLVYFNLRGRAEQIRWILAQAGAKYEDKRVEQSDWPQLKPKTPVGSMPYLEADGKCIGTSGAVAIFLAREYGLLGCNSLEAAKVHMFWECTQDAFNAFAKTGFIQDPAEKEKLLGEFFNQHLPKLLALMSAHLKDGCKYLVGNKLTMADLVSVCLLSEVFKEGPGMDAMKPHAAVCDLVKRVMDLPNIKNWIATRPKTDL